MSRRSACHRSLLRTFSGMPSSFPCAPRAAYHIRLPQRPLKPFFRISDIVPVIVGGRKSIIYFISLPADYPAVFIRSKTSAFGKGQIDRSFLEHRRSARSFFRHFLLQISWASASRICELYIIIFRKPLLSSIKLHSHNVALRV